VYYIPVIVYPNSDAHCVLFIFNSLETRVDYVDPNGTLKQVIDKESKAKEKQQSADFSKTKLFYEN